MNTTIRLADSAERNPYRGERQTRLSAVWSAIAIAVVAVVAVLVFILQNPREVTVSFLVFQGRLPLAVALLFAMMLGAVIVLGAGAARILQLRGVTRRARRSQMDMSAGAPAEPSGGI